MHCLYVFYTAARGLLTLAPSNTSITEGDRLTLTCEVAPSSLSRGVTVRWLRDGQPLTGVTEDNNLYGLCVTDVYVPYYVMSRRGSLCIASARSEDSGLYVCVAFSNDGMADHGLAFVNVAGVLSRIHYICVSVCVWEGRYNV